MLKSCGARGVDMASPKTTACEKAVKRATALGVGADRSLVEGMQQGLLLEGMGVEDPLL
jgi:hypothetical protein